MFSHSDVIVVMRDNLPKHYDVITVVARRRSHLTRLIAAFAMLVLLGIPWLFSAFAVIDAPDNKHLRLVEGVFQVVFVVFVNLQGLFIFTFHCARNDKVRTHWRSSFSHLTSRHSTAMT